MTRWLLVMVAAMLGVGPVSVLGAAPVVREAEEWGADTKQVCLDATASGEKALVVNFTRNPPPNTVVINATEELPAGVYSVTFFVAVRPLEYMHKLGVLVAAGDQRRTLHAGWFEKSLAYRPVRLEVNHPGGALALAFGGAATTGFGGMRRTSSDDERTAFKALEANMGEEKKAPKPGDDTAGLEDLEGAPKITSIHPAELIAALDKVEFAKLAELPAHVFGMAVDKIHYRPGETVKATLNVAAVTQPGKYALTVFEIREAATAKPVFERELELAAGAPQKLEFSYVLDAPEFGRQLLATLRPVGTPVAAVTVSALVDPRRSFPGSVDAFFGVSQNVYRIGISADPGPSCTQEFARERADQIMAANKAAYANYYERFAWAPCDYSCLAPETERFWSGQTQYPGSISGMKSLIDAGHARGIKAITYGKYCADGIAGFNTFQKHPEFFGTNAATGINTVGMGTFMLERMLANEYSATGQPCDGNWQDWQSIDCDWSTDPACVDFGADAILDGVKMFGWDGVRWDGHFVGRMDRFKAYLNPKAPGFVHGYNIANANPGSKMFLPGMPVEDFHECAKDHGLMMDESVRDYSHTNFSYGRPEIFYQAICREGDYMKRIGGLPLFIMFDMASQLDHIYNVTMGLAGGQRYTYATTVGDFEAGPLTRWLTRYSAFVWDDTKAVRNPAAVLTVDYALPDGMKADPFPLLWQESCWVRTVGPGEKQLLVNLCNPPRYPAFCDRSQPPALHRRNVSVSLAVPAGAEVTSVLHLSVDLPNGMEVLPAKTADGRCMVTVPRIAVWSIVAFSLKAPAGTFAAEPFQLTTPVEDAAAFMKEEDGRKQVAKQKADAEKAFIRAPDANAKARGDRWTDYQQQHNFDADDEATPEVVKQLAEIMRKPADGRGLNRNGLLDVHHARGLFSWLNNVQAAVGVIGGGHQTVSWMSATYGKNTGNPPQLVDEFPDSYEQLFSQDVLILDNLHAAHLGLLRRIMIKDFVANGGGLLIFGGYLNLSCGQDHSTWLEELMPVTVTGYKQLATDNAKGFPLSAPGPAFFPKRIDWTKAPVALSVDTSPLKPGAKVLLQAGDHPAIVSGSYGKGRVVVVLMDQHGNPAKGLLPYWEWRDWPYALGACIQWLGNGCTDTNGWEKARRELLEGVVTPQDFAMEAADLPGVKFTARLKEACQNVVDAASAKELLLTLVDNRDKLSDPAVLDVVTKAISPYPDPEFAAAGEKLIESDLPELKIAGARVLGSSKNPAAFTALKDQLGHDDPLVRRASLLALGAIEHPKVVELLQAVAKKDADSRFIAVTLLSAKGVPGSMQAALPLYLNQLKRIRNLKCDHFAIHDSLYGGVSFKLTAEARRAQEKIHARIERVERAAREDGARFEAVLWQIQPAQVPEAVAVFAATENRDIISPAYTVIGRLSDLEMKTYIVQLKAAKLKDIRLLVE